MDTLQQLTVPNTVRADDVDTNLGTKPGLLLDEIFFTIGGDQEESKYKHWARDSRHPGQEVGATSYHRAG